MAKRVGDTRKSASKSVDDDVNGITYEGLPIKEWIKNQKTSLEASWGAYIEYELPILRFNPNEKNQVS